MPSESSVNDDHHDEDDKLWSSECIAEPPVASPSSSLPGTTTNVSCPCRWRLEQNVVLVAVLPHRLRCGGRSLNFPARLSNPLHALRGSHRPINAQECASTLIRSTAEAVDRSRVRIAAAAELRGEARAACETAYTGAVRSIHH